MKKVAWGLIYFICFVAVSSLYIFHVGGENSALITNIVYLFPPFIAMLSGIFAVNIYGDTRNDHARALMLLITGLTLLFIGEVIWFYYRFTLNVDPFPSIADLFYLCAYPFLFFGLMKELRINNYQLKNINSKTGLFFLLFSAALIFLIYYFGIYLAYDPAAPVLNNVIAICYGIVDYFLIIPCLFILKIVLTYKVGKLFAAWYSIFLAFICMLLGDIAFALYQDAYSASTWPYTLIDLFWIASYFLFGYGFLSIYFSIQGIHTNLKKRIPQER